jgi:FkbM family methyltransferase
MRTVFDIGMYDGADTAYCLQSGYRVVAVEANPELVQRATEKFAAEKASGQMICVNAAISTSRDPVELVLSDRPGLELWRASSRSVRSQCLA